MKKINFIENSEIKQNHFYEPYDNNPNGFKLYMTSAFIGPPRSGKTQSAINLAKYLQDNKLITETFIISPTINNNPFNILNIDEEHMIKDLDNIESDIMYISDYCKQKVNRWKNIKNEYTERQYNNLYKKIYQLYLFNLNTNNIEIDEELLLNDDDHEILKDNKYLDKPTYYKCGPSFLIIFDDINGSSVVSNKKFNPIVSMISNHRHNHINLFILTQNYTNSIPANVRRLIKQYFLYKVNDVNEIKKFYTEIASSYFNSFEQFEKIYRYITNELYTFILIDTDPKRKDLTIRKNFNYIMG